MNTDKDNKDNGKIFALKNLVSSEVNVFDTQSVPADPERMATKDEYREWSRNPRTEDAFLSCVEGRNPAVRVSEKNPAAVMYGLVLDYDTVMSSEAREKKLARMRRKPTFISESYSGGTRAIYLFEEPIRLMDNADFIRTLLSNLQRRLRLDGKFGVLDTGAYGQISHYYQRGWGFREAGGAPIPAVTTCTCAEAAWKAINWRREGLDLPLERVEEEIRLRYPDALGVEPLCEGFRCKRFWDASADNPTAAECRKGGFRCYTGPKLFVSWRDILGEDFCEEVKFGGVAQAMKDMYFIGNSFWVRAAVSPVGGEVCNNWVCLNRQNTEALLASRYGLSACANPDTGLSQVKEVVGKLINEKALQGCLPFLYRNEEVVVQDGAAYLNTNTVQALSPAAEEGEYQWIAGFLHRLFGGKALPFFLAWLARTYQGALQHKPTRGQALFIAGPSGVGKSFLSECILAPLLGGRTEATAFLTGKTQFNKNVFNCGLLFVDDAQPLADIKAHSLFSAVLKQLVANDEFLYRAMYHDSEKIRWLGRIVVTLNDDPQSLGMLPDVTISNQDKLMFFRTCREELTDPDAAERVAEELPYFARFLSTYVPEEEYRGTPRYGVKGWHDPELFAESQARGVEGTFREVFEDFLDGFFGHAEGGTKLEWKEIKELRGSSTFIQQRMQEYFGQNRALDSLLSPRSIGIRLGALASSGSFPLRQTRTKTSRAWVVERDRYIAYRYGAPVTMTSSEAGMSPKCHVGEPQSSEG